MLANCKIEIKFYLLKGKIILSNALYSNKSKGDPTQADRSSSDLKALGEELLEPKSNKVLFILQ